MNEEEWNKLEKQTEIAMIVGVFCLGLFLGVVIWA